jgi:hypothetical protein
MHEDPASEFRSQKNRVRVKEINKNGDFLKEGKEAI